MQILVTGTEIELESDVGLDTVQFFQKLEVDKVSSFKLLLISGVFR